MTVFTLLTGNINESFLVNGKSIRARLTSDDSVTASGVRVAIEDADPVNPNGPRYLSRSCITNPADGVREAISWYDNLNFGKVGYLHTKSIRYKMTEQSPYYEREWKHSNTNNQIAKTWHSYAGNMWDFNDRVSTSTHYRNVFGIHWWWNPKNRAFDPQKNSPTKTCAGSAYDIDGLISSRFLGRSW